MHVDSLGRLKIIPTEARLKKNQFSVERPSD